MYCRTCGSKLNDNAEICVKCGVKKNVGTNYCQVCGAKTTADMKNCSKCGGKLFFALSSSQMKEKTISKGKKVVGNFFFVIGVLIILVGFVLMITSFFERSSYESTMNFIDGSRSVGIGAVLAIIGRKIKKPKD